MPLIDSQPDALSNIYAKSLLQLAHSSGGRAAIEATLGELEDVLELARSDAKFSEFLASRVVTAKERESSIRRIFEGRVSDLTLRFLLTLNRKGRLDRLLPIVAAFDAQVQSEFGRVEVDVFTAEPMSADDLHRVRDRLAATLGKDVVAHPYTDSSMIGGVKLRIGDQLIDGSLATQLRKVRDQLGGAGSAALRAKIGRLFE